MIDRPSRSVVPSRLAVAAAVLPEAWVVSLTGSRLRPSTDDWQVTIDRRKMPKARIGANG